MKMKRKCVELLTKLNCGAEMKNGKNLWLRLWTIMNRVFGNKLYKLNNLVEVNHPAINHSPTTISNHLTTTHISPTAIKRNPRVVHVKGIINSLTASITHMTTTRADSTATTCNPRIGVPATVISTHPTAITTHPTTTHISHTAITPNPRVSVPATVISHSPTTTVKKSTTLNL